MKRNLLFADYCSLLCALDGFWAANRKYDMRVQGVTSLCTVSHTT